MAKSDNDRQAKRAEKCERLGFVRASASPLVLKKDKDACKAAMLEAASKYVARRVKAEDKAN